MAATSDSEGGSRLGSGLAADGLDPEKIWRRTDVLVRTPRKLRYGAVLLQLVGLIPTAASVNFARHACAT
jgi:hypothetical protein